MPATAAEAQPDRLPGDVLDVLAANATAALVPLSDGCFRHASGKVKGFGGVFNVKAVLFEQRYSRPVPTGCVLIRTCQTFDCIAPEHLVPVARAEWGRVLGRKGGLWRPAA